MILVDTSIWVDHFHAGDESLTALLNNGQVMMHPFVLGELACGTLRQRVQVLGLLKNLPDSMVATCDELLIFIERRSLMGRGIGYVDAHLLAAVVLDDSARLWTRDKRLHEIGREMHVTYAAD